MKLLSESKVIRASSSEIDQIQLTVDMGKKGHRIIQERTRNLHQRRDSEDATRTLIFMGCTVFCFHTNGQVIDDVFTKKLFHQPVWLTAINFSPVSASGPQK
jgi:hypothetical protein